jgi:hypothetical protein
MEIIPARPGKDSKPDGVTVWTTELDAEIESLRQFEGRRGVSGSARRAAASWRGGDGPDEAR